MLAACICESGLLRRLQHLNMYIVLSAAGPLLYRDLAGYVAHDPYLCPCHGWKFCEL